MARRKTKPITLSCPECGEDGSRVRVDYVGEELVVAANVNNENLHTDVDTDGLVVITCKRHSKVLGRFEPFRETRDAGRDIIRPDPRSFMLAMGIAMDKSLSYPSRALGMLLLLTRACSQKSLRRRLSWPDIAECLEVSEAEVDGLFNELASRWLTHDERGMLVFRDATEIPAPVSDTLH